MPSEKFNEILNKMREIHARKNHDYAQDNDPFSNFKRAALISEWFNDPVDKVFVTMIGIKLARLAELHNGKEAKNESVNDSHLDLEVYATLWDAYHQTLNDELLSKWAEDLQKHSDF